MEKPRISADQVAPLFDTPYIHLYDLQYAPGKHYYNATRRSLDQLVACKSDEEFQSMYPDAVSCVVILKVQGEEPRLLLSHEYRYPAGQFLLSVPAGLLDAEDLLDDQAIITAAKREIAEETGLHLSDKDTIKIVNPLLFSTPGMTDESNALVCAVIHLADVSGLSQEGAVGSECFDGFSLLTAEDAKRILKNGRDDAGYFYSVYTWAALMYFVSGLYEEK